MDAFTIITEYMANTIPMPDIQFGRREFDTRIYERWAAELLLSRVMEFPDKDPVEVAEDFLLYLAMETAKCFDNKKLIFSSAIHTIENLIKQLKEN